MDKLHTLFSNKYCIVRRQHRVFLRKHLGEGDVSMRVEKVLALLIESGFVYCCIWVRVTTAQGTYTGGGVHHIDTDPIPDFGVSCVS
jgi:hypothetical protein